MEELWHEVSELMWNRPLLWLPVLIADLLGSLIDLGRGALVRAYLMRHLQFHSALGGPVRGAINTEALQAASAGALAINWVTYLLRMLLYACALVATAALVMQVSSRMSDTAATLPSALRRHAGGMAALAARALPIYAVTAAVMTWLVRSLLAHGHKEIAGTLWLRQGLGVGLIALLAVFLAPAAVALVAESAPSDLTARRAQVFSFSLGIASLAIGAFVGANSRTLLHVSPGARFALEATGSLLVALPFVPMFLGLGVLAAHTARDRERVTVS